MGAGGTEEHGGVVVCPATPCNTDIQFKETQVGNIFLSTFLP